MLEEDERVVPGLGPDTLGPGREVRLVVLDSSESEVSPGGGGDEGRVAFFPRVGHAQGGVAGAEYLVYLVVKPGGMPELQRRPPPAGQQTEERPEARNVLLQVRRELKERGSQPFA